MDTINNLPNQPGETPSEEKIEVESKANPSGILNKPLTKLQTISLIGTFLILFTVGGFLWYRAKLSKPVLVFNRSGSTQPILAPLTLTLESPVDEQLFIGEELLVKGKTLPNIPVVVFTDTDTNSTESDEKGSFETTIVLAGGINSLTVSAFADNGEEKSLALNLVYDDQVKGAKTPPGQEKKVENTSPAKKAEIGNVESVSPNSLTIQKGNNKGKYKTTIDKDTKIVGQDKKTVKLNSLKPADLAAIVASESGEATKGGQLKKALKIFIKEATSSAQAKRRAVQGVISAISGNTITLTHQIQTERVYTLLVDSQTVIKIKGTESATLVDLKIGQRIAAVGDLQANGNLLAKRIHVIPGKATGVFKKYPTISPGITLTVTPTATASVTPTVTPAEPSPTPTEVTATPTLTEPTLPPPQ